LNATVADILHIGIVADILHIDIYMRYNSMTTISN